MLENLHVNIICNINILQSNCRNDNEGEGWFGKVIFFGEERCWEGKFFMACFEVLSLIWVYRLCNRNGGSNVNAYLIGVVTFF